MMERDRRLFPVVVATVALIPALAVTAAASRAWHRRCERLGAEWSDRGGGALARHDLNEALLDFRNAVLYLPENRRVRLQLAETLASAGQVTAARAHLLTVWRTHPQDGAVNLALARLAARDHDIASALLYYRAAVGGVWPAGRESARRTAAAELREITARHW